jgi:probable rRNA maturation factor
VSPATRRPGAAPRLAIDVAVEGVRLPVAAARVRDAATAVLRAERVPDALLSFTFLTPRAMARLNREHLGHAGATDVISFGFARAASDAPVVGDVYICPDVAREHARANGCGVREELLRLVVHGTLHVLGHEHPLDEARMSSDMWRRQERLLARVLTAGATRASGARR